MHSMLTLALSPCAAPVAAYFKQMPVALSMQTSNEYEAEIALSFKVYLSQLRPATVAVLLVAPPLKEEYQPI